MTEMTNLETQQYFPCMPGPEPVETAASCNIGGQKLELWNSASEEERLSCEMFLELKNSESDNMIRTYFDFADKWFAKFPKNDKKYYERGMLSVKRGAKLAGISPVTVYKILQTASFYGRDGFESLKAKAKENGVLLKWTHLRTIAERLHNNRPVRTKIEKQLITNQLTEKQLHQVINEAIPPEEKPQTETSKSSHSLALLLSAFESITKNIELYQEVIDGITEEYEGNPDKNKVLVSHSVKLLECFDSVLQFIQKNTERIEVLPNPLFSGSYSQTIGNSSESEINQATEKILQDILSEFKAETEEKAEKRKRQELLAAEMFDDDNEDENEDDLFNEISNVRYK